MTDPAVVKITELFNIPGNLLSVAPYGSGHINKTFLSIWEKDGSQKKYIHQCINNSVFTDVDGLMKNISTILNHIEPKIKGTFYLSIELIPAKDGNLYIKDSQGKYWRTYNYLEGTKYVETCQNAEQAREAGRIIGFFQNLLIDLDVKKLKENIRKFTSAPHRLEELEKAISKKPERLNSAKAETDFAKSHAPLIGLIESKIKSGKIPKRPVHGDTKINNVLFDEAADRAVCLVDLDTSMPGYSLYDFGDLVRSISVNTAEDEQDFSKIKLNHEYFKAVVSGYLENAGSFLNPDELELLHVVPQLIALTLGIRFLTDYLNNDIYFKINRPLHNLERARTQFKIFEEFKNNEDAMKKIVMEGVVQA